MSTDGLNLDIILTRSEDTYSWIGDLQALPPQVREHFNYDVPALIGAVKRLTGEVTNAEQDRDSLRDLAVRMERAAGLDTSDPFTDVAAAIVAMRAELVSAQTEIKQLRAGTVTTR